MEQQTMNLAIAINRRYVRYAYVMLSSFFTHHALPVNVFVMHRDLQPSDMELLGALADSDTHAQTPAAHAAFHFLHVPDSLMPPDEVLASSAWGPEAYFRLAVVDLLPADIDRVLYLDTDMIVNKPLTDMYFRDIGDCRIAACREHFCDPPYHNYCDELFAELIPKGFCYFNSGTILYRLDAMRADCDFASYMELARRLEYRIEFPDQDLLNYRHYNEVYYLDASYNQNARYGYNYKEMHYEQMKAETAIIHYASSKPWRGNFIHCDVEQLWWDYAARTPFHDEFLEEIVRETMADTQINSYITDVLSKNERMYQLIEQYDQLLKRGNPV